MIERQAYKHLKKLTQKHPIVCITGPRQSGKTTLSTSLYPDKPLVSLDNPRHLELALSDSLAFLERYKSGAIFKNIHKCPLFLHNLKAFLEENPEPGLFIFIASESLDAEGIIYTQLSDFVGFLELLPFSLFEANQLINEESIENQIHRGFYPELYAPNVDAENFYCDFYQNFLERDVARLITLKDKQAFALFVKMCAARVGQPINCSSLGNDCGVSHNTAKEWLGVLEKSYLLYQLPSHPERFSKRRIKSPKLYFYDTGLLCWLLQIDKPEQIQFHAMRGVIFENLIITNMMKQILSHGDNTSLWYWRDHVGLEVELVLDDGEQLTPIAIRSGKTVVEDYFKKIDKWLQIARKKIKQSFVIYSGEEPHKHNETQVLPWRVFKGQ